MIFAKNHLSQGTSEPAYFVVDCRISSSSTATAITTETNFAKHVAARRGAAHGGGLSNGALWLKYQHIVQKL